MSTPISNSYIKYIYPPEPSLTELCKANKPVAVLRDILYYRARPDAKTLTIARKQLSAAPLDSPSQLQWGAVVRMLERLRGITR